MKRSPAKDEYERLRRKNKTKIGNKVEEEIREIIFGKSKKLKDRQSSKKKRRIRERGCRYIVDVEKVKFKKLKKSDEGS